MKRLNLINFSLLALALTACQDEDFGFTKSEVYQSYIDRKYAEEFAKAFPDVDPNHTWMCTPDTIYHEVEVPGMTRAAGDPPQAVVRKQDNSSNVYAEMAYSDVSNVLKYMGEGDDNYSNRKAALDFEYKAIEDNGTPDDGYEELTITPTFWGRKFTDHNAVGIYYYDAQNKKKNMDPFWDDNNNRDLYVVYKDGYKGLITPSTQQITDDPNWANSIHNTQKEPNGGWELTHPCSNCGNVFQAKEDGGNPVDPVFVDKQSYKCIKVNKKNWGNNNRHDTQFFISTGKKWNNGDSFTLKFDYIIERDGTDQEKKDFNPSYQDLYIEFHDGIGGYRDIINTGQKFSKQDYWQTMTITGTIKGNNINTIALDLHIFNVPVNYYFKNIRWYSNSQENTCGQQYCEKGKIAVDHYELPQYTLKVPVGTVWGVYLKTDMQQGQNSHGNITWYSNSDHNEMNNDGSNTHVKSAATFTYNNVTYISFEDAPTLCSGGFTGTCKTCGRGHYDHDYNDIVLTITPRPVEKTYRSISYRVMCEDLGGTFDWDFNDVVYDVIYADGTSSTGNKATVTFKLQAIGGTLPIYMEYKNSRLKINNKEELHELSTGQNPDNKGLYVPVNVVCDQYDVKWTDEEKKKAEPITLKTIRLENQKYSDTELDVRDYVKDLKIVAQQKNGATTEVVFPLYKGNATPQCFMTSIGTEWPDELQPIDTKYPIFKTWVSKSEATNWWGDKY